MLSQWRADTSDLDKLHWFPDQKKFPKENWYLLFESLISTRLLTRTLSLFSSLSSSFLWRETSTPRLPEFKGFNFTPHLPRTSTAIQLFSAVTARSGQRSYALHFALERQRRSCTNIVKQTTVWKKSLLGYLGYLIRHFRTEKKREKQSQTHS